MSDPVVIVAGGDDEPAEEVLDAVEAAEDAADAAADAAEAAADAAESAAAAASDPPPPAPPSSAAGDVVDSLEMGERIRVIAREEAERLLDEHAQGAPHLTHEHVSETARTAAEQALDDLTDVTIPDPDVDELGDADLTIVTPDVGEELLEQRKPLWQRIWG